MSQVVLSFGIPFALVPLVLLTSKRKIMGPLVNKPATILAASLVTAIIVGLNVFLIAQTVLG
jgi:manganese transport protein